MARAQVLECLYKNKKYQKFNEKLKILVKSDPRNIRAAAVSAFVANQLNQEDPYPFCKNPFEFFHVGSLRSYTKNVGHFVDKIISAGSLGVRRRCIS